MTSLLHEKKKHCSLVNGATVVSVRLGVALVLCERNGVSHDWRLRQAACQGFILFFGNFGFHYADQLQEGAVLVREMKNTVAG